MNYNLVFFRVVNIKNLDGSYRYIREYKDSTHNKTFRYNKGLEVYISEDGIVLNSSFHEITIYTTKGNSGRNYPAFNTNKQKRIYLHRAIAYIYVPGYDKYYVVDHIDNNPFNFSPNNLQYLTRQQNTAKECGKLVIIEDTKTHKQLQFNTKKSFYDYFKINSCAISMFLKAMNEMNIKQYIKQLEYLSIDYKQKGRDKASETVNNMIEFIDRYSIVSI